MGFRVFIINEISLVTGSTGVSHNGIFRGKDLGTISSLNEYIAFRTAHGIDDKSYTDLYLGDYFKIQDGTYNAVWMVAHFDYYYNKGNLYAERGDRGVLLIPRTTCSSSKMNTTDSTEGGYKASLVHTTTLPAIATALTTVFGSYLYSNQLLLTNATNATTISMAGAGLNGASTSWQWTSTQCVLPNEVQMFGTTVTSSSWRDVGEGNEKLAIFNFVNPIEYGREYFWMRSIAGSLYFSHGTLDGGSMYQNASDSLGMRPLIYIG